MEGNNLNPGKECYMMSLFVMKYQRMLLILVIFLSLTWLFNCRSEEIIKEQTTEEEKVIIQTPRSFTTEDISRLVYEFKDGAKLIYEGKNAERVLKHISACESFWVTHGGQLDLQGIRYKYIGPAGKISVGEWPHPNSNK